MNQKRIHVAAKTWEYKDGFKFPEEKYIKDENRVCGLAISGGGNRSASLTIGYLRALHKLELIQNVKYISCVSGGAWASIPYTFLDSSINDDDFLGEFIEPEDLTFESIQESHNRSFTHSISETRLIDDFLGSPFAGDERFAKIMSNLYLKPYLIGDQRKFFSLNKESVAEILNREGNSELRASDFYTVNKDRPYLISGGILTRSSKIQINRYPFEMTPLYVGIPSYFPNEGSISKFDIGGGYVESFGFDTDSPNEENDNSGLVNVRIRRKSNIFSIADVMATTGAALAEHIDRFFVNLGFPEFKYWSPKNPDRAKEYDFADGGLMDNSGIMPLLRRKVKKIVVFVNGTSDLRTHDQEGHDEVSSMVKALFTEIGNHFGKKDYTWNIVLKEPDKNGEDSYQNLRQEFVNLNRTDKPAVVKGKYITVRNNRFDINAGHEVEIMWVHNAFVQEWYNKLKDPDLKEYVAEQHKDKNFPNMSTFFTNNARIIDLDLPQANIMAHHASYVINSMSSEFKDFLG